MEKCYISIMKLSIFKRDEKKSKEGGEVKVEKRKEGGEEKRKEKGDKEGGEKEVK